MTELVTVAQIVLVVVEVYVVLRGGKADVRTQEHALLKADRPREAQTGGTEIRVAARAAMVFGSTYVVVEVVE